MDLDTQALVRSARLPYRNQLCASATSARSARHGYLYCTHFMTKSTLKLQCKDVRLLFDTLLWNVINGPAVIRSSSCAPQTYSRKSKT